MDLFHKSHRSNSQTLRNYFSQKFVYHKSVCPKSVNFQDPEEGFSIPEKGVIPNPISKNQGYPSSSSCHDDRCYCIPLRFFDATWQDAPVNQLVSLSANLYVDDVFILRLACTHLPVHLDVSLLRGIALSGLQTQIPSNGLQIRRKTNRIYCVTKNEMVGYGAKI